eukprot:m.298112 g.298112  ORF g.298112 m.298112 type:complete len:144 (+) comp40781_c1_seq52:779-1210(+)
MWICSECHLMASDGIRYRLPGLAKQQRPGAAAPVVFHSAFPSNVKLCPKAHLNEYLKRSSRWRSDQSNELFLSVLKPHKKVTRSTRYQHFFKAHSVRRASASAAFAAGISSKEIMEAADWSSTSTFVRHYCRPISPSSSVGHA